jgi:hypothetical protein
MSHDNDYESMFFVFAFPELRRFVQEVITKSARRMATSYPDMAIAIDASLTDVVDGTHAVAWRRVTGAALADHTGHIWRPIFDRPDPTQDVPHVSSA